jgi:hypothetical protein
MLVVECWNTFGDIGAAIRASNRKRAEAEALAAARWGLDVDGVHLVWVVRSTRQNRALLGRYPELFGSAFPGSSRGWVRSLVRGAIPPRDVGLVWASVDGSQLIARRSESVEGEGRRGRP